MWRLTSEGHLVMTSAAGADVTQSLGVLAEACRDTPPERWPERVRHVLRVLAALTTGATDAEKVMPDYRQAELRLKVQIYPEGRLATVPREMYVARAIGPGLLGVLVLDLPGALAMVPRAQAIEWGQTHDALYATALLNSWAGVPVTRSAHELATGLVVYSLETGSAFTAIQLTALEHHLGQPAPLGALVTIPTVHMLMFHVIKDAQAREALASLASMALKLSLPRPLVISPFVYWWRAGRPLTPLTEIEGTRYRIALPRDYVDDVLSRIESGASSDSAPVASIAITQESPVLKELGTFTQDRVVIGKRPDCDVRLVGVLGISGHHAILEWRDGALWLTDPGAAIPVRADGAVVPFNTPVVIASGTRIQLGPVAIVVRHRGLT